MHRKESKLSNENSLDNGIYQTPNPSEFAEAQNIISDTNPFKQTGLYAHDAESEFFYPEILQTKHCSDSKKPFNAKKFGKKTKIGYKTPVPSKFCIFCSFSENPEHPGLYRRLEKRSYQAVTKSTRLAAATSGLPKFLTYDLLKPTVDQTDFFSKNFYPTK